ncbi:MAG: MarR family transcriptional regulator [Acidimicrobiales bacterium]|jgi:DNA-binding MarR family transcriptional regulator
METTGTINMNDTASRLRRAVTRLNRRLRSSSLGGISPAQASMLGSIEKLDNPSLGDLAVAEQMKPPSVTRVAQAMQEVGLIVCFSDPEDRRVTRVRLSAMGRREIAAIRQRKTEFLEMKLRSLSPSDQRRVEELASLLERLLEE